MRSAFIIETVCVCRGDFQIPAFASLHLFFWGIPEYLWRIPRPSLSVFIDLLVNRDHAQDSCIFFVCVCVISALTEIALKLTTFHFSCHSRICMRRFWPLRDIRTRWEIKVYLRQTPNKCENFKTSCKKNIYFYAFSRCFIKSNWSKSQQYL